MTARSPDAGFTLLEVLVALAVLAVGAVSLLGATQTHVARISEIEDRTVSRWVAEYRLTALRLGLATPPRAFALGQEWTTSVRESDTADADLKRVDIAVATAADGREVYRLIGFVDVVGAGRPGG